MSRYIAYIPPPFSLKDPPKLFPGTITPHPTLPFAKPLHSVDPGEPDITPVGLSATGQEGAVCRETTFRPEYVVLSGVEPAEARTDSFVISPRFCKVAMEVFEFAFAPSMTSISPP